MKPNDTTHFVRALVALRVALVVAVGIAGFLPPQEVARADSDDEATRLLVEAHDYWRDWRNRRRETAIQLFQTYLAADPESIWRADIYWRFGMLYAQKTNRDLGEKRDDAKAIAWFEKALEIYGDKYCFQALMVRSEMAGCSRSTAKRREYYEWLCDVRDNATAEDVWPYKRMGVTGWLSNPELDLEQRQADIAHAKEKMLPRSIKGVEETLVRRSPPVGLARLVSDYPGTPVAERAQEALNRQLEAMGASIVAELLEGDTVRPRDKWRFSLKNVMAAANQAPRDGHSLPLEIKAAEPTLPAPLAAASDKPYTPWIVVAACALSAFLVAAAAVFLLRRSTAGKRRETGDD